MKLNLRILIVAAVALCVAGCANTRATSRIVSVKHTVFGLDVASDPTSGGTPAFRLGLVRSYWQEVPTSTNRVYAAPLASFTEADVKLSNQHVTERITTVVSTNAP
jgi:hypothetical protein